MQGAPVKYFKILLLPQFSCSFPLGPVSQAARALLRARASSMAAACSQLLHLCIQHSCLCKGCAKGCGGALASGVLGVGPQKRQSLGKDCFPKALMMHPAPILCATPSLKDAVCPRGVPTLPHVPHKAEQGCWCCSCLCAEKVCSSLCSEKVIAAIPPSPVPVAPFLPSCGALIDATAPSTRSTHKHLYPCCLCQPHQLTGLQARGLPSGAKPLLLSSCQQILELLGANVFSN